ncbi:hypothetical protein [Aquimarina sediminis]|uniref:hypothetical protein n=1 Tax=Aquimarina sediminis TaxID=2070536 RepID=UPI000FFE5D30|nr:hypothetical protein [Aquimarina sediminis]
MKRVLLILTCLIFQTSIYTQESIASDTLYRTTYFTFHNNVWMNLYHFFYEQACNRQKNKLAEDGLVFNDIGDSVVIMELSSKEKALFNDGVAFFKKNIIDQKLLNSRRIFKWLQNQPSNKNIIDTTFSKEFTENLNRLSNLYKDHFWQRHQKENVDLLNNFISLIEKTENSVIGKMEDFSGSKWNGAVRVDLTTYGNWAGAYSPDFDNLVISSIDPMMNSTIFIEFVFHESSHLLFTRKSPFRQSLFLKSKELDIKQPRQLWHAAMFYLSGLATREVLNEYDVSHELIMKKKSVFTQYYENKEFKTILSDYYKSNIEMDAMSARLLKIN